MNWQGVVLPIVLSLVVALVTGYFQRPKVKADVSKSETDEEVALRELRLKEQAAALKSAWDATADARKARDEAVTACAECRETTRRIIAASENLADAVQLMLDEPDDIVARQTARLRLREYRQAI